MLLSYSESNAVKCVHVFRIKLTSFPLFFRCRHIALLSSGESNVD